MPQMFPMSWIFLPSMFLILFILFISNIYIISFMSPLATNYKQQKMAQYWQW